MKQLTIIVSLLILFSGMLKSQNKSQNLANLLGDTWLLEHAGALQIGDTMPDILLGTVLNNTTGNTRFSDFKGKLIILDFWNTYCTDCIAAFPRMESFQKQFGDSIQILMVNAEESVEAIQQRFNSPSFKAANIKLPNLPIIVNRDFMKLFSLRFVPHHVWIDGNGVILQRGHELITYPQKIENYLQGKHLFTMNDQNTRPAYNPKLPYYTLLKESSTTPSMTSLFSRYNRNIAPYAARFAEGLIDSANQTIRSTYVNLDVLDLYRKAYDSMMEKNYRTIVFSPHGNGGYYFIDYFMLNVEDTLLYTSKYKKIHDLTDELYIKSIHCYEQNFPLNSANKNDFHRHTLMIEDLNRYFGQLYGVKVEREKRTIPCYAIIRTSQTDKLKSKGGKSAIEKSTDAKGQKWNRYINRLPLRLALQYAFPYQPAKSDSALFVLDETGFNRNRNVDMTLPQLSKNVTIEDMRAALKPYDLDIIKVQRPLDFIVITEKK